MPLQTLRDRARGPPPPVGPTHSAASRGRSAAPHVRVWHPPPPDWERQRVRNDDSVVIEVRYGDVSIVLPGDISAEVERSLAAEIPPARHRVLKAAHHGSATSTSDVWLDALRPDVVVFSCGRENRYGHPAPAVLRRVRDRGAKVFRTDQDGQVVVETDGKALRVSTFTGRAYETTTKARPRKHDNHEGTKARRHEGLEEDVMQMRVQSRLSDDEELVAHEVIACALAVHRELGPGYLESFYRKAMCIELRARALAFETEKAVEVRYRGELLGTHRIDLIVQGLVVVELKAVEALDPVHRKQVVSYLKATKLRLGLLDQLRCGAAEARLEASRSLATMLTCLRAIVPSCLRDCRLWLWRREAHSRLFTACHSASNSSSVLSCSRSPRASIRCSTAVKRSRNLSLARRSAASGSTPSFLDRFAIANRRSPISSSTPGSSRLRASRLVIVGMLFDRLRVSPEPPPPSCRARPPPRTQSNPTVAARLLYS